VWNAYDTIHTDHNYDDNYDRTDRYQWEREEEQQQEPWVATNDGNIFVDTPPSPPSTIHSVVIVIVIIIIRILRKR